MSWTIDTLHEHLLAVIDEREKAVLTSIASSKEAIEKAERATEKRLEGMNEFRAALNDRDRLFIPRAEYETVVKQIEGSIGDLKKRMELKDGEKAGRYMAWLYVSGDAIVLISLAALFGRALKP